MSEYSPTAHVVVTHRSCFDVDGWRLLRFEADVAKTPFVLVQETEPQVPSWRDLAPAITRQRLIVEGTPNAPVDAIHVRQYLHQLSHVCGMRTLTRAVTHRSDRFGWAGWIHWETSGAHFYAWEQPLLFFSVDIYTCKLFDPVAVVDFTAGYFDADQIAARSF